MLMLQWEQRGFLRGTLRKYRWSGQSGTSHMCLSGKATNEKTHKNNVFCYFRLIFARYSSSFASKMRVEMTLREKIRVEIGFLKKILGVGGKKMAPGEADITISTQNYISFDSLGPSRCFDIKKLHLWWLLRKLARKMWREIDTAKSVGGKRVT